MITIFKFDKKSIKAFIDQCTNELAHCFYEDTRPQRSQILHTIREIGADLKTEEWGYLRGYKNIYLYRVLGTVVRL